MSNWYGIPNVKFVWHGEWADPGAVYKGVEVDSVIVEDTMWERWIHDDDDNLITERETDDAGFAKFMRKNAKEVKELLVMVMKTIAYKEFTNYAGIEILYADSDCIVSCWNNGEWRSGIATSEVHYNAKGEPFFNRNGHREYIKDYMRVK